MPRLRFRSIIAVLSLLTLLTVEQAQARTVAMPQQTDPGAAYTVAGCPLFPPDNPWNTDISRYPIDPNTNNYIAGINRNSSNQYLRAGFGLYLYYGIPWVIVPGSQPMVPITFTSWGSESDPGPYPIPPDAPIEQSNPDHHVIVLDSGHCKLYEMYDAAYAGPGWTAGSGAVWDLTSNATRPAGWTSADSAGLPIFPGLIRYDEVATGAIHHALRMVVHQSQRRYIPPATHFSSTSTDPSLPPMGLRLRLKANFDLSPYTGDALVILQALKKYGAFVADNGSDSWYVSGTSDARWNRAELETLRTVPGTAFEVVLTDPLIAPPTNTPTPRPTATKVPATALPTATKIPPTATLVPTFAPSGTPVPTSVGGSNSGNLLVNGGFEASNLLPWYFSSTTCTWSLQTVGAQSGNQFAAVQRPTSDACVLVQDLSILPTVGETYTVGFYGRQGTGSTRLGRIALRAPGGTREISSLNFALTTSWQCYSTTLPIQLAGHTSLRVEFYLDSTGAPDTLIDTFRLVRGTDACTLPTATPAPTATPVPSVPNLMPNSGFEVGNYQPWQYFVTGVATCNGRVLSTNAYSGIRMFAMTRTSVDVCNMYEDVNVVPQVGDTYTLSFYGKGDGKNRYGRLGLRANGGTREVISTNFMLTTDWACYSTHLTFTQSDHTGIRAELYFDSVGSPDFLIDSFTMVRGTTGCQVVP